MESYPIHTIGAVILSERSESKDPDNVYVVIAVEGFLSHALREKA